MVEQGLFFTVLLCCVWQCSGRFETSNDGEDHSRIRGLDLLLNLVPCDVTNAHQRWSGLSPGGQPSALLNIGSELCVSDLTEPPQAVVGLSATACGELSSFLRRGRTTTTIVQNRSGLCLEAAYERGVPGVYFMYSVCDDDPSSPGALDQQFVVPTTDGLIESKRLPGFCIHGDPMVLPKLPVLPGGVISHGFGDMNVAFHFAYSAGLAGVCGHDSQPYHCAVQYFLGADQLVPQTNSSSVPYCDGCPEGMTLLYDHCKNHAEWVDVGSLPDYARGNPYIDDVSHLYNSSVYLSRAECGTYGKAAVVNTMALYGQLVESPTVQILYRDMCAANSPIPFPYQTSPDPFVETECLEHVYGPASKMAKITRGKALRPPAPSGKRANSRAFRQNSYLDSFDVGFDTLGYLYIPDMCQEGFEGEEDPHRCTLLINWHGCGGLHPWDWNGTLARFAESNGIVLLAPKMKGGNNVSMSLENAHEVGRGCWDSYGQTGQDYATKLAPQISSGWRMVQQVVGTDTQDGEEEDTLSVE